MEKLYHIGRDRNKNNIYIIDESVSSTHAQVFIDEKVDIYIVDLSSKNGVYVNGEKISGSTKLENNDKISLGNFSFSKEDLVQSIKIYENLMKEGKERNISILSSYVKNKKEKKPKRNYIIYVLIIFLLSIIGGIIYYVNNQNSIKEILNAPSEPTSEEIPTETKEDTKSKEENPKTKEKKKPNIINKQSTDVTYDFSCLINAQDELGTSLILGFGDLTRDVQNDLLSDIDVTIQDEINIGNDLLNDIRKESEVKTSGKEYSKIKKIMNDLVSRLSSPRGFRYEIFLIDNDTINAYTLGGKIFFYKGMYEFCKNESELAAIISHEIAHNELGHSILEIKKITAASEFGIFGEIALLFESETSMSFNQKQEAEADLFGADLIYASDFNNCSSVEVWERSSKSEENFDQIENLFLTHPYSKDRANCIKNHFKNNYNVNCN